MTNDGPIDEYLRETKMTLDAFEKSLKKGDAAAASVFAAEIIFNLIDHLAEKVENKTR